MKNVNRRVPRKRMDMPTLGPIYEEIPPEDNKPESRVGKKVKMSFLQSSAGKDRERVPVGALIHVRLICFPPLWTGPKQRQ